MPREHFRLALGDLRKLPFERVCDTRVEYASRLAQQGAIGRVLHQGMLEQIGRVRRHALAEQQTGPDQTVEFRAEFGLWLAHHGSQQRMRKLTTYRRPDLCPLLGPSEPG